MLRDFDSGLWDFSTISNFENGYLFLLRKKHQGMEQTFIQFPVRIQFLCHLVDDWRINFRTELRWRRKRLPSRLEVLPRHQKRVTWFSTQICIQHTFFKFCFNLRVIATLKLVRFFHSFVYQIWRIWLHRRRK